MSRRRPKNEFQSFSLLYWLATPFRLTGRWLAEFSKDDRIKDHEGSSVLGVLLLPLKFIAALFLFMVSAWAISRRGWAFVLGIPAILVVSGGLMATWLHHYFYPRLTDRWQLYYENFLIDEDRGPQIAQYFAAKRVVFEPDDDEAKYQLATVWEQVDKRRQAEDLMQHLANKDLPRAHLWFARKYLAENQTPLDPDREQKARDHIESALKVDPENPSARALLASFYLIQSADIPKSDPKYLELVERAAAELEFVNQTGSAEAYWQLPNLIRSLMELEKEAEARTAFNQARRSMEIFMRRSPDHRLIPAIWTTLIRSTIQLNDFQLARSLAGEAIRQGNSFGWGRELLGLETQIVLAEANFYADEQSFSQRLDALAAFMVEQPNNSIIGDRLIRELGVGSEDSEIANHLSRLEQAKLVVRNPEIVHLLLGIGYASQGQIEIASTNWRIAGIRDMEKSEQILRTLLTLMVDKYQTEFQNVLDAVSLAMEMYPNQPLFYEVRGIYWKNQNRFQEAIADFSHAAATISPPRNFTAHLQLVECYEALDNTELANDHRRTLQKMINTAGPSDRRVMEVMLKQVDERTS